MSTQTVNPKAINLSKVKEGTQVRLGPKAKFQMGDGKGVLEFVRQYEDGDVLIRTKDGERQRRVSPASIVITGKAQKLSGETVKKAYHSHDGLKSHPTTQAHKAKAVAEDPALAVAS